MKTNQWDILADFESPRIESYDLGLVVYSESTTVENTQEEKFQVTALSVELKKASIKHKNFHNLFWANELCW